MMLRRRGRALDRAASLTQSARRVTQRRGYRFYTTIHGLISNGGCQPASGRLAGLQSAGACVITTQHVVRET